jgi:hypothetical protein
MFFVRFSLIAHHLKLGHKLRKKYDKLIQNPDCKEIEASYQMAKNVLVSNVTCKDVSFLPSLSQAKI